MHNRQLITIILSTFFVLSTGCGASHLVRNVTDSYDGLDKKDIDNLRQKGLVEPVDPESHTLSSDDVIDDKIVRWRKCQDLSVSGAEVKADLTAMFEDGWVLVGSSTGTWTGAIMNSTVMSDALKHVGADLVMIHYKFHSERQHSRHVPHYNTHYHSGNLSGNTSYGGYSGSYSGTTTTKSWSIEHYTVRFESAQVSFWVKSNSNFGAGMIPDIIDTDGIGWGSEKISPKIKSGVKLLTVVRGSIAASSGFGAGNVIFSIGGTGVNSSEDLNKVINLHSGKVVDVEYTPYAYGPRIKGKLDLTNHTPFVLVKD